MITEKTKCSVISTRMATTPTSYSLLNHQSSLRLSTDCIFILKRQVRKLFVQKLEQIRRITKLSKPASEKTHEMWCRWVILIFSVFSRKKLSTLFCWNLSNIIALYIDQTNKNGETFFRFQDLQFI